MYKITKINHKLKSFLYKKKKKIAQHALSVQYTLLAMASALPFASAPPELQLLWGWWDVSPFLLQLEPLSEALRTNLWAPSPG